MNDTARTWVRAGLIVGMAVTGAFVIWSIPPLFSAGESSSALLIAGASVAFVTFAAAAQFVRIAGTRDS